jgi:hypothetical protein
MSRLSQPIVKKYLPLGKKYLNLGDYFIEE